MAGRLLLGRHLEPTAAEVDVFLLALPIDLQQTAGQRVKNKAALLAALDQVSVPQDAHVMGGVDQLDLQDLGNLRNVARPIAEDLNDAEPFRGRQGAENLGAVRLLCKRSCIANHPGRRWD